MQATERDYSLIDFVNERGIDFEWGDFLESFAIHIVSHKCKSFNNNNNHQNKMQMPTNECIEGDGQVLLGYAQENEPIQFIDYFDDTDNEEDDDTDLDIDIEENKNMDRIFDLEIEETLASALDLLPEFCSIPIDDDMSRHNNNIDQCLKMLKHINSNCNSQIYGIDGRGEHKLINKISEMRDIIESLQCKLTIANNQSREGFVLNCSPYSDNDDENEDEGEDVYRVIGNNITLMGEGQITA